MIRKTERRFKRQRREWERGYVSSLNHIEHVKRETWWLLGLIPLYTRDFISYMEEVKP